MRVYKVAEIKGYLYHERERFGRLKSDLILVFSEINLSDQICFSVIMCAQALV